MQVGSSIPVYAVIIASITACVIGLINIGSSAAFNDVISLSVTSLYTSYIITESFLLYRRCTGGYVFPEYFFLFELSERVLRHVTEVIFLR